MCRELLRKLFFNTKPSDDGKESPEINDGASDGIPNTEVLAIPFPEEAPDFTRTVENTCVADVVDQWMIKHEVPQENWELWRTAIDIQVYDQYPDSLMAWGISQDWPSFTWESDGKRHMAIKSAWLNVGVIAHEQAHNAWALLTETQQSQFAQIYESLKDTDPYIKLLRSVKEATMYNIVEIYAELYRYLGRKMPIELQRFYLRLIM